MQEGQGGLIDLIRMSQRRSRFVAVLAVTVSLVGGCSQEREREGIEASFESYKDAVLSKNGAAVAPLVSQESLRHYDRLRDIALTDESSELDTLQWVDQMQVLMFRQLVTVEELGAMSPQGVVAFVFDRKMLGKDLERTSTFDQLEIKGDVATARHIARGVSAGGPEREAKFRWVKEDDNVWRIDLLEAIALIQGHFDDTHRLDFPDVSEEKLAHGIVETFTQRKLELVHFRPMTASAPGPSPAEMEQSATAEVKAVPPLGSPPTIELVEQGDPPYRKLRWKLRKGEKQRLAITTITNMQSQVGGRSGPRTRTPSLTYELMAHTRSVDRAGKARLELEVVGVRVDSDQPAPTQLAAQLKEVADSLRGTHATVTTDARGSVDDFERRPGPHAGSSTDQMSKLLETSITKVQPLLPEEEVGQGAKWVVRETVQEVGVTAARTSSYSVAQIDGSQVDIAGTIEQTAPRQAFRPPGASTGSAQVVDFRSQGTLEATLNLESPFPTSARLRSALTMQVDAGSAGGTAGPSTLSVDTEITVDSKGERP